MKYLDRTRAVIASCLEPVFAIVFAAAFVHEGVHGLQVIGIAAVLATTVMAQVRSHSEDRLQTQRRSYP